MFLKSGNSIHHHRARKSQRPIIIGSPTESRIPLGAVVVYRKSVRSGGATGQVPVGTGQTQIDHMQLPSDSGPLPIGNGHLAMANFGSGKTGVETIPGRKWKNTD